MIKLKELVKQQCECGDSCCSVNESTEDKIRAQKKFQSLMRQEGLMRDRMFKLEQAFLADSNILLFISLARSLSVTPGPKTFS